MDEVKEKVDLKKIPKELPDFIKDSFKDGLSKTSKDVPSFTKNMKNEKIKDMKEADKPLRMEYDFTEEEIKEISPFSDSINEYIRNPEELEVYENADLQEDEINGKTCLVKEEIPSTLEGWTRTSVENGDSSDLKLKITDSSGRDNLKRMKEGTSPLSEDGNPVELHHIGQGNNSPLAELTQKEHRGAGNFSKLHTFDESNIDREHFNNIERRDYWKKRSEDLNT